MTTTDKEWLASAARTYAGETPHIDDIPISVPLRGNRLEAKKQMRAPEVEAFVQDRMPTLLGRLWDLAMGAVVLEEQIDKESGEVVPRIYRFPPDRQALQFLIENGIGKVPNRIEMTGEGGGPMRIMPWAPAELVAGLLNDGQTIEGESRDVTDGA